jgi:hypothetical protein
MTVNTKALAERLEAIFDYMSDVGSLQPDELEAIEQAARLIAGMGELAARWRKESAENGDEIQRGDGKWECADELESI